MTSETRRRSELPVAEAGVAVRVELARGVDRREGVAAPSQPRDFRPPRQGQCEQCGRLVERPWDPECAECARHDDLVNDDEER